MPIICQHCKAILAWHDGQGYVHPGGGMYMVYCRSCGWQSDKAEDQRRAICPVCGDNRIWDDHVVLPIYQEGR